MVIHPEKSAIRLGFIIPTKDRLGPINTLLRSIYKQTVTPALIIVVDGSEKSIEMEMERDSKVPIMYLRELPPGLTKQRNRGISAIPDDLSHVGFLDDDLEMVSDACEHLLAYINEQGSILAGASFNIVPDKKPMPKFIRVAMGISAAEEGGLSMGGSVGSNIGVLENRHCKWLCGGATVWRRDILQNYKFDEWFEGYALWEDVDYSYRVGKDWKLGVVAAAKVYHWHVEAKSAKKARILGDLEVVDRFYFVSKFPKDFNVLSASWASFCMGIRNLYVGFRERDVFYVSRFIGNLNALGRCIIGRVERDPGLYQQK